MFKDATQLTDGTSAISTAIVSGPDNGKTIRKSSLGVLSIGSQPSNENGSSPSVRCLVDVSLKKADSNGKLLTAYVRTIIMTPVMELGVFSAAEIKALAARNFNFFTLADGDADALAALESDNKIIDANDLTSVPRLLAGEP